MREIRSTRAWNQPRPESDFEEHATHESGRLVGDAEIGERFARKSHDLTLRSQAQ
jgi:hypothetical protein